MSATKDEASKIPTNLSGNLRFTVIRAALHKESFIRRMICTDSLVMSFVM
jgi:hypothetical protein